MKKYMPKTDDLVLLMSVIVVAAVFYGQEIPKNFPFAEFFSKMGKIGSSLLMLLHTLLVLSIVWIITTALIKYDKWRNTPD